MFTSSSDDSDEDGPTFGGGATNPGPTSVVRGNGWSSFDGEDPVIASADVEYAELCALDIGFRTFRPGHNSRA